MPGTRTRPTTSIRDAPSGSDWQPPDHPGRAAAPFPRGGFERLGRYGICQQISAGGMASVHLGFLLGSNGFSRFVAIKRMRPELARDASLVARFEQEVLLGARIQHPAVVQALDVVSREAELLLVMEFIHGENLSGVLRAAERAGAPLPIEVALSVVTSALHGLHAAHEATDEHDVPLALVHRDFSPQNVLVGSDGYARILDFGIAKTHTQVIKTDINALPGKVPYMAPEQLRGHQLDRRCDVFAAGVVLWEALAGKRLFGSGQPNSPATILEVLERPIAPPSKLRSEVPPSVDAAVLRALNRAPGDRFSSAREFALALEATGLVCGQIAVAECLRDLCAERLAWLDQQQDVASRALALAGRSLAPETALGRAVAWTGESVQAASKPETVSKQRSIDRPRAPLLAAVAGVLALLVVAGTVAWQSLSSGSSRHEAQPVLVRGPAATNRELSEAPAASGLAAEDEPVQVVPQVPVPAPSASVSLPRPSQQPTAARTGSKSDVKSRPASCTPPTYLDERGIRHFKAQCL